MIVVDTSALVLSITGPRSMASALRGLIERGERMVLPSIVVYEWLRGPRKPEELGLQEALFPTESALAFGAREAALAAELYSRVRSPRGRVIDLAIAATAICHEAELWTANVGDFQDIPGIRLAGRGKES
jgi:predicted nucleic acid-binding protein